MLIFVFHKRNTIIMKKITSCAFILFFISFISCKKEVNQGETVKEIKTLVTSEKVTKDEFNTKILPRVEELYQEDSVKYRMINHIANKAKKEKNKTVFKENVKNLKDELKFIK